MASIPEMKVYSKGFSFRCTYVHGSLLANTKIRKKLDEFESLLGELFLSALVKLSVLPYP